MRKTTQEVSIRLQFTINMCIYVLYMSFLRDFQLICCFPCASVTFTFCLCGKPFDMVRLFGSPFCCRRRRRVDAYILLIFNNKYVQLKIKCVQNSCRNIFVWARDAFIVTGCYLKKKHIYIIHKFMFIQISKLFCTLRMSFHVV